MKLLDKYFSPIKLDNLSVRGGYVFLNRFFTDVPLKDIKLIDFESLYPHIICGFVESNYHKQLTQKLQIELEEFQRTFKYFQLNKLELKKDSRLYTDYKLKINSFYGKLGMYSKNEMSINIPFVITEYLKNYYEDLIDKNRDSIYYIDTDHIIYTGEIDLLEFNVPYNLEKLDYVIFSDFKKYVYYKNGKFYTYPYYYAKSKSTSEKFDNQINIIKKLIREDRIQQILT